MSSDETRPSGDFFAVTPEDDAKLKYSGVEVETRGVYIGGGGNVLVKNANGDTVAFNSVQAGSIIPVKTTEVRSTNTTATNMVALL